MVKDRGKVNPSRVSYHMLLRRQSGLISVYLSLVVAFLFMLFHYTIDGDSFNGVSQQQIMNDSQSTLVDHTPECIIRTGDMCYLGIKKDERAERGYVYCEGPMDNMNCSNAFRSILKTDCNGRLGNVMMAYATLFYLKKLGFKAIQTSHQFRMMRDIFEANFTIKEGIVQQYDKTRLEVYVGDEDDTCDIQYDSFLKKHKKYEFNKLLYVGRYPTPFNLFLEIWPELMEQFKFKPEIVESARMAIQNSTEAVRKNYPNKDFVYVAVHNRREDYVKVREYLRDIFADDSITVNFFNYAMDQFRSRYDSPTTKVLFLMVGNEPDWNEKYFSSLPDFVSPARHYPIEGKLMPARDMVLMSMCNHTIRTWGTFSLWPSLMNNGTCIYASTHLANRDERHLELLKPAMEKHKWSKHEAVNIYDFFPNRTKKT